MKHANSSLVQPIQPARLQFFHIVFALVLREAGARFGRSTGGYIWAFAEPVAGILLLSMAFSYLLRSPPIGDSFFLFYASGVVPLLFFNAVSSQLAQSVKANRGLLNYPVVSVLDVIIARLILETATIDDVNGASGNGTFWCCRGNGKLSSVPLVSSMAEHLANNYTSSFDYLWGPVHL